MEHPRFTSYISQYNPEKKGFGFYLIGSLVIILFSFFGQIPMFFFLPEQLPATENQMDLFAHLDSNLTLFLLLFPSLVAFFGFLFVINKMHQQSLVAVSTARAQLDSQRILFGFLFWGLVSILVFGFDLIISPEDYVWNFKPLPFLLMFVIACCFIPFQSALEEWIFRGYLMQGFAGLTKSRFLSLALTSIIFGSLHAFNPEVAKLGYGLMAYYIGTGFFFGIMSLMDDGIELAIGFHVANNLVTAILITADWTAFQTESLYKDISTPVLEQELILFLLLIYPITLFYLGRKYQWNDWRNKLTGPLHGKATDL